MNKLGNVVARLTGYYVVFIEISSNPELSIKICPRMLTWSNDDLRCARAIYLSQVDPLVYSQSERVRRRCSSVRITFQDFEAQIKPGTREDVFLKYGTLEVFGFAGLSDRPFCNLWSIVTGWPTTSSDRESEVKYHLMMAPGTNGTPSAIIILNRCTEFFLFIS